MAHYDASDGETVRRIREACSNRRAFANKNTTKPEASVRDNSMLLPQGNVMRTKAGASGAPCSRLMTILRVRPGRRLPTGGRSAILTGANLCVLSVAGRSGIGSLKREGDGKTPPGRFRIIGGYFRSDRLARIRTRFALKPIQKWDSWCDDPGQPVYNRPIRLPSRGRVENMWRQDHAYDLVLVLDYNYTSRVKGRGSAIFFHLWRSSDHPTEGCIAVSPHVMRCLLPRLSREVILTISL